MASEFIFQGISAATHLDAAKKVFATPDAKEFALAVAFVSENGVAQLEELLQAHHAITTVYAGIRNDITSYQALLRLIDTRVTIFVVDTARRSVVFHPKIFLAVGKKESRAIVGSANLTLGGLNNNVEGGLLLNLDMSDNGDVQLVASIKEQFEALKGHAANVRRLRDRDDVKKLLLQGLLTDERRVHAKVPNRPPVSVDEADQVPPIKVKTKAIRGTKSVVEPEKFVDGPVKAGGRKKDLNSGLPDAASQFTLVWASKPLTERDLTLPSSKATTNPTGSINLDKGQLAAAIDHRSYFFKEVFNGLAWTDGAAKGVIVATAQFDLVVKQLNYGQHSLVIAHSTSTESKSFLQRNAMTRIRWGKAREFIKSKTLLGLTLYLYKSGNPRVFMIEIA